MVTTVLIAWIAGSAAAGLTLGLVVRSVKALYPY
jgi:hypothetical protein